MKTLAFLFAAALAAAAAEPIAPWSSGVTVRPLIPNAGRHLIHAYFNISPESPDGRWVVYYSSPQREGYQGEVRILERATGKEIVLARNVTTEDAHRAACQQWVSRGERVVFHDLRSGEWVVATVEVASGKERVLARDRLVAWGSAIHDFVPIYGKHWAPGKHRDLELLNVVTGEIRKVVTADQVKLAYPELIAKEFGERPISIFFPILSPDASRVFFKIATPTGGDYRSTQASHREQIYAYDLAKSRFLFGDGRWGHPAWHPDSRTLINSPNMLWDSNTSKARPIPDLPVFRGSHPSISPDGELFVTDYTTAVKGQWAVAVAEIAGTRHRELHRFDNSKGANSWRVSHPHPVFSADGRRVYFNVNDGPWTRLMVAEAGSTQTSRR